MADRYEYEDGRCTICGKETSVRWKNLFTIGSEGTWMCIDCERATLRFLTDRMMDFTRRRKAEFLEKKLGAEVHSSKLTV